MWAQVSLQPFNSICALPIHRSPLWGSLRAGAQPMFHSENLSAYAGTINKAVDELITNLSAVAKSCKEVNIFTQLGQMTMQVTGAAAFGYVFLVLAFLASWGHPAQFSMAQGSLSEASDRLQVSKMMSHSTQAVIGHAYLQIGPGGAERPCSCHADLVLYINSPAESA